MVYFVETEPGGPIKIGQTITMTARIGEYRRKYGPQAHALGVMEGGREVEKSLLDKFAHLRIAESVVSEYFSPGEDLLAFIAENTKLWDGKDDLPPLKRVVIHTFSTPDWRADEMKAWLDGFSLKAGYSKNDLIDKALKMFAKSEEYDAEFPNRRRKARRCP